MCCTISTGTGRSAGSLGSTWASASGPPVEEPMTRTAGLLLGPLRGAAGRGGGGGAAAGPAVIGRPVSALILGISCSRTLSIDWLTLPTLAGLVTYSLAPAESASRVAEAPRSVSVLNMTMGTRLRVALIARTASMPFISGISMSIVIRSGLSWSSLPTAILPFTAVPTTSMSGSADNTSVTILRTTTESSTTITLIGFTGVLLHPRWARPAGCRLTIGRAPQPLSGAGAAYREDDRSRSAILPVPEILGSHRTELNGQRRFVTRFLDDRTELRGDVISGICRLARRNCTGRLPAGRRPAGSPSGRREPSASREREGSAGQDGHREPVTRFQGAWRTASEGSSSRSATAAPCTQPARAFQTPAAPSCRSNPPSRNARTACSWPAASVRVRPDT